MRADQDLDTPIARHVWETRYRARLPSPEPSIASTWARVANALAEPEPSDRASWERRFLDIMPDFSFLPGGRILAGAGTGHDVTLFNCFVMGTIENSIPGIFRALEEGAVTMQRGGGGGYDFSTIRPSGALARTTGAVASGPVSFMDVWDAMCATIQSTGSRRGAMMAMDLPIEAHIAMQATLQHLIDNAISKTVNIPSAIGFDDFAPLYRVAYDSGVKGCAAFRPTPERDAVLTHIVRSRATGGACICSGECK